MKKILVVGGVVAAVALLAVGVTLFQDRMRGTQASAAGASSVSTSGASGSSSANGPLIISAEDPLMISLGSGLYADNCASCHGDNLEGQANWKQRGSDGLLPAPPHDETGHSWHHADGLLFEITKQGSAAMAGGGYQSAMAGYADTLKDAEIIAVIAYIKSRWPAKVQQHQAEISARYKGK